MGEPTAGFVRSCRVDCRIADFHERDFSIHIDYVSYPIRHTVRSQYSVRFLGGTVFEIAEQRERKLQLIGKDLLGGSVVGTNAKNLCFFTFKFCDTSLVRGEFLRSATGESSGEERQDYGVLAFEIGKSHFAAHRAVKRKVRRDIADFERRRIAGLLSE